MQQPVEQNANLIPGDDIFNISEIFYSIQGEGLRAGLPCVFIRMQGCKLRCSWCDTPYALDRRKPELELSGAEIISKVREYNCNFIEFTGGEPLEQRGLFQLMTLLCNEGYTIAVETGGHIDASPVDNRVVRIIDVKCPDSKMESLNFLQNLEKLRSTDEIKFVIASRADFDYALAIIERYNIIEQTAATLISPAFGLVEPQKLASWILAENKPLRLQMQIHKFIWEPSKRGV